MKSLSLLALLALTACNPFAREPEIVVQPAPAPIPAPAPVAAPAVVPVLTCATSGGDVLIGTDLYHTVETDVVIVKGVKPDSSGNCTTKAGHYVELTCFTDFGACAEDVKLVGIAGFQVADPAKRSTSAFQPTASVTAEGTGTDADASTAYQLGVKALRAVGLVERNDKVQDEKIARLSKCATGDEEACTSFSIAGGPPAIETATAPATPAAPITATAPATPARDADADPDDAPETARRSSRSGS